MMPLKHYVRLLLTASVLWVGLPNGALAQFWSGITTIDGSAVTARHETGAVEHNGYLYVFGGRHERQVERYDVTNNLWEVVADAPWDAASEGPLEMHHFQPVVYNNRIYIIGAFTCCYPVENIIPEIYIFDPADNTWTTDGVMPGERQRGSAGTFVRNGKIYLVGGNTRGHSGGAVAWFDEYDPATGIWRTLEDAPTARDHFQAVLIGNKLIVVGGRQSNRSFANTIANTDIYDFASQSWSATADQLPTPRAGTMAVPFNDQVYVLGGESASITDAHSDVEIFNPDTERWAETQNMQTPRHAGGAAMVGSVLHVFAGSTTRGAAGETSVHESIDLALASTAPLPRTPPPTDSDLDLLTDADEVNVHNTDPNSKDTDDDGLDDYYEIFVIQTNPLLSDTDGDGLLDGDEINEYATDAATADTDGDGIDDGDELFISETDPTNSDSDADSISDGIEVNDLNSDPLKPDTDDDGLSDGEEYNTHGSSPTDTDSDNDGLNDYEEVQIYLTNPLDGDTDGDFLSDKDEVITHLSNPLSADSDADGISDSQEVALGTNLNNNDQDGDGLNNAIDGVEDADGDGLPNYLDLDSDNDTIPDVVELGYTDNDQNGLPDDESALPTSATRDTDDDGIPDYLDVDSDQDGLTDYSEATADYSDNLLRVDLTDSDNNGLHDAYRTAEEFPRDSDGDGTPDYLDSDSDNDGISDLKESGSVDADTDGKVDNFTDVDMDGMSDVGTPVTGEALPDDDGDAIPDFVDAEYSPPGCTVAIGSGSGSGDPLLPALLAGAMLTLWRRKTGVACIDKHPGSKSA